ncbi:tetratricopeptide repeat protein [Bacillus alkalicellulosilyticus]|uniref:tetratricopeptide repeat protein n=1 Tax=Alkalihalobacterium alkalicellulosilyticum TaxID=1912214 RepID=UPI0009981E95|nr:tetratricopeptide repeat protein [Bacillus alkalicellulosilyticus]
MLENHYGILEITSKANQMEVKKAYAKKIREFPNEKYPDQFMLIRRAYEVLSNEKSRKEFDTMATYGEEIQKYQQRASESLQHENFLEAIHNLKKILLIEPSLLSVRNQLGLAFLYNGDVDKGMRQFEKLVKEEPHHATYWYNLGSAYENKNQNDKAIDIYRRALELDPQDPTIIFTICDVFVRMNDYSKATATLLQVLDTKENEGFRRFMYIFKLLQLSILAKKVTDMEQTLYEIEELLHVYPEEKQYVAQQFGTFAFQLFKYKWYKWAYYLTEKGVELDPDNMDLRELHERTLGNKQLYAEFELMEKDEKIMSSLKHLLYLYLFGDELEEEQFNDSLDTAYSNVQFDALHEPKLVIANVKRIDIKYSTVFSKRKDFFTELLSLAIERKELHDRGHCKS